MNGSQNGRDSTPVSFFQNTSTGESRIDLKPDCSQSPRDLLKSIAGVGDADLALDIVGKASDAIHPLSGNVENTFNSFNIVLQSLHDFQPKNALEARLIAQSAALYTHGMKCLQRSEEQDLLPHAEHYTNKAAKLLRLHNETIETLSRLRRGGEQKVTVQHTVIADKAVVNNFTRVGGQEKSGGGTPCSLQNAVLKQEQTAIDHVDSPQWQMGVADSMEEKVLVQKRQ